MRWSGLRVIRFPTKLEAHLLDGMFDGTPLPSQCTEDIRSNVLRLQSRPLRLF